MPEPRGRQGTVRGLRAEQVQALLAHAVEELRRAAKDDAEENPLHEDAGLFSRADVLAIFTRLEVVSDEQAQALVHAFWRVVQPHTDSRGKFRLPDHAEALVEHRNWRITSGRLQIPDVLQLRKVLRRAQKEGVELTPGVEEFLRRSEAALKGINIKLKEVW
jgi:aminopeptidase N